MHAAVRMIKKMLSQGIAKERVIQLLQVSIADTQMQQVTATNSDYPAAYSCNTLYSVCVIFWLCQHSWEMLSYYSIVVRFVILYQNSKLLIKL